MRHWRMGKTGGCTRMTNRLLLTLAITTAIATLAGCSDRIRIGEPVHETKVLELDKSEMTRVELKMGAGELHVTGGSPKLMEADFDYNSPGWKPEVDYHSTGHQNLYFGRLRSSWREQMELTAQRFCVNGSGGANGRR
jgi:hypothetical protein